MKLFSTALAVSLISVAPAFANQATDSIKGPITCESAGKGFSVTISANRKSMTISKDGEKAEVYKVEQNVGDTEIWYAPKGDGVPTLSFNDEGDFLQFNSKQNGVDIKCPQGKD